MSAYICPCGFAETIESRCHRTFSRDWYRAHKAHHLTVFPNVDSRTVEVLDELIEGAA